MRGSGIVSAVLWVLCCSLGAGAEPADETIVWYVVRPGDSLRQITERYLGSQERWQENWRLNPGLENPNFVTPGKRLRIIVGHGVPQQTARVVSVHHSVEESPAPLDWSLAEAEDLLVERDGVRTQAASSTELEFAGGHRMTVTENSLVFIRSRTPKTEQPSRRGVEIVHGQADLKGGSVDRPDSGIELILGSTTARPRATAEGPAETRARRPQSGGAKVMLYRGQGDVAAGGGAVKLAAGMGTSVPEVGVPSPPEKLLPAPVLLAPEAGARLDFSNPVLEWQAVEAAHEYILEICGDPGCTQLMRREVGLQEPPWRPEALPVGELYWRITARSASGLDGYPSGGTALSILSDQRDLEPPEVAVRVAGPSVRLEERLYLGAGARLEVVAEDGQSGIGRRSLLFDGEPMATTGTTTVAELKAPGPHRVWGSVADRVGNRQELEAFDVIYDPLPPTITWEPMGPERPEGLAMVSKAWPTEGRSASAEDGRKRRRGRNGATAADLEWSGSGLTWQTLDNTWQAPQGIAVILLRTKPGAGGLTLEGPQVQLSESQRLRIDLGDGEGGVGLGEVSFGVRSGAAGGKELFLEAKDLLENHTSESWRILPGQ